MCALPVRPKGQRSPRVHAGAGALPFLCGGRRIKRTFLHYMYVCGCFRATMGRHRSVPADSQCKTLLNLESLLGVGLKLLTAWRAWGKTERKGRGIGSEKPFSVLI